MGVIFCYSSLESQSEFSTDFSVLAAVFWQLRCWRKKGFPRGQAHAISIALILPLSIISLGVYYLRGNLSLGQSLFFFVPALLGSVCGAWCLKRIPVFLLKISFSLLILYSAAKILLT